MITAIAIDDEPKAIEVIQHHISKIENIKLLSHFHTAKDALVFLKQNPVDVIFLDINMPHMSGLEMLNQFHRKSQLIFTTAYSQFAVESYNHDAVDYLLKPFEFDRFQIAIERLESRIDNLKHQQKFIFIKDGFKNIKIEFDDTLYIKGSGNYLDIVTTEKTFVTRMTFTEIVNKIPSSQFIRVHQSYIVNIDKIEKIENNHIYIESDKISISSRYKEMLYRLLGLK